MLKRYVRSPRYLAALSTLLCFSYVTATSASALASTLECTTGMVVVLNGEQVCIANVNGHVPPDGSSIRLEVARGSSGGIEQWCIRHQQRQLSRPTNPWRVPCNAGDWWFHVRWDCYMRHDPLQAPASWMRRLDVSDGEDGRVFEIRCFPPQENDQHIPFMNGFGEWQASEYVVGPENPPGYGGTPSVIPALWVEAVNSLGMRGPQIRTAPPADGAGGLVNLPVWLWTETGGNVWPEDDLHAAAVAAAVGQRVDAYARPLRIEWHMGDGSEPVTCAGPGEAWRSGLNFLRPGECHHVYRRPSRTEPDGRFEVVAVTTWLVWWFINGEEDGQLELQVGSTTSYRVNEVQVLNSR